MKVIRERGAKLNADALKIMPYTDAVIKEAMRLGAIVNIVPKRALKTFEIGGYTIPKVANKGRHICWSMSTNVRCVSLVSDIDLPVDHF